jgi:uncharacterized protein
MSSEIAGMIAPELAFLADSELKVFNGRERPILNTLKEKYPEQTRPGATRRQNIYFILKATRLCNLRCSYCHAWRDGPNQVMPLDVLAKTICEAMRSPDLASVCFVWHGGETTLLSPRYFEKALWLQEYFRIDGRLVQNSIQTNATLINDAWARFFRAAGFSVGVSLDLDGASHNASRVFSSGAGSWDATLAGLARLRARGVAHGILAVLTPRVVERGARWFLDCAATVGAREVAILNALPRNGEGVDFTGSYLPWAAYSAFLRDLFRTWRAEYANAVTIRELSSLFEIVRGSQSRLCIFAGNCMGKYLTVEPDGTVAACDKYIGIQEYVFGNINEMSLSEILTSSTRLAAKQETAIAHASYRQCRNWQYCRGGCPHDMLLNDRFQSAIPGCCGLSELIDDMKAHHQSSH